MVESAVSSSVTWAEVCRKLGIQPNSGSQTHLSRRARLWEIDYSHFKGRFFRKGVQIGPKRPIEEYLIENSTINSDSLRRKLINAGLKPKHCEICLISEWMGEEAPLELDHINNIHTDCRFENLMILCPNCHALKTRNVARERKKNNPPKPRKYYPRKRKYIPTQRKTKKFDPSLEELTKVVWEYTMPELGKIYGVSGSAVSKRCKKLGIPIPSTGYWQKKYRLDKLLKSC